MSSQTQQLPPEAAGPGTYAENGTVRYGDDTRPRTAPVSRRDPDEVAAERARTPLRCGFCEDIPAELLAALRDALADARKAAR